MTSFRHSLGFTSHALQVASREQTTDILTAEEIILPSQSYRRMAFPAWELGLYLMPSVSIHTFMAPMTGPAKFPAFRLLFIVRQARFIAAVFNPVNILYLGQAMFGHLPFFIQGLFKMTADMHQAVEQPHVGVGPESCLIACKTIALK